MHVCICVGPNHSYLGLFSLANWHTLALQHTPNVIVMWMLTTTSIACMQDFWYFSLYFQFFIIHIAFLCIFSLSLFTLQCGRQVNTRLSICLTRRPYTMPDWLQRSLKGMFPLSNFVLNKMMVRDFLELIPKEKALPKLCQRKRMLLYSWESCLNESCVLKRMRLDFLDLFLKYLDFSEWFVCERFLSCSLKELICVLGKMLLHPNLWVKKILDFLEICLKEKLLLKCSE